MKFIFSLIIAALSFTFPFSVFAQTSLTINEFSAHPSGGNKEWIELYNPEGRDVTGYWIDDDPSFLDDSGSGSKKSLDTIQQSEDKKYVVIEVTSLLNNAGDAIVLFDSTGTLIAKYEYHFDPGVDVTIGRFPDGEGEFGILNGGTKGESNSEFLPTVTPTPTNTPIPTPTPSPTKIPTPTKVPTATKEPTITKKVTLSVKSQASAKSTRGPTINLSGVPTSILGVSTSASPRLSRRPTKTSNSDSMESNSPFSLVVIIVGGVLVIGCGILMWLKLRNKN